MYMHVSMLNACDVYVCMYIFVCLFEVFQVNFYGNAYVHMSSTQVGSQQKVIDYKFGAIHRALVILEKYGYPLSHDRVQFFHHVPQRYKCMLY